jgi:hypothetical protein
MGQTIVAPETSEQSGWPTLVGQSGSRPETALRKLTGRYDKSATRTELTSQGPIARRIETGH